MAPVISQALPVEQCPVNIQFPLDSLNLSYLLNRANSSGISLVGINGYIYREEKLVKKKKDYRYREVAHQCLLIMKKETTSFMIPSFLSLSEKEYCQHSASSSKQGFSSTDEIIVHLHPRLYCSLKSSSPFSICFPVPISSDSQSVIKKTYGFKTSSHFLPFY